MLFSKYEIYAMILGTLSSGVEVSEYSIITLGNNRYTLVQVKLSKKEHLRSFFHPDLHVVVWRRLQT